MESNNRVKVRQVSKSNLAEVKGFGHMHKDSSTGLTRVISVTSGKGGVGKTTTVVNLGMALALAGKRVLILDADLSLANIHVMIGKRPEYTLEHVCNGTRSISEILVEGPAGIQIIPATSGVQSMCQLDSEQQMLLMQAVESIAGNYDYLLIDTQAGIGQDVMYFNSASNEVLCVINSEPTSLTDAYALIKILATKYGEKSVSIVVNNVPNVQVAKQTFERLNKAVNRFLHVTLSYKGFIPSDQAVPEAVREQRALLELYPSSSSARAFVRVAESIDTDFYGFRIKGGMQFFFKQLIEGQQNG